MEIIAASMRETNLTYPNIFSETFKQSMYAKQKDVPQSFVIIFMVFNYTNVTNRQIYI